MLMVFTDYYMVYHIEKGSYKVRSIDTNLEFMMNVQGLITPVVVNNHVEFYNYGQKTKIDPPALITS